MKLPYNSFHPISTSDSKSLKNIVSIRHALIQEFNISLIQRALKLELVTGFFRWSNQLHNMQDRIQQSKCKYETQEEQFKRWINLAVRETNATIFPVVLSFFSRLAISRTEVFTVETTQGMKVNRSECLRMCWLNSTDEETVLYLPFVLRPYCELLLSMTLVYS